MKYFIRMVCFSAGLIASLFSAQVYSFCGFYVAKADTGLFNRASKVVMVRDEERTVITMASDYQGETKDFALVIPVPTVLQKSQIHITENKLINHLDAYTAPRLVEYHDDDPCMPVMMESAMASSVQLKNQSQMQRNSSAAAMGVTIEAEYTVGEYDILILSAKQSDGLQSWLDQQGYRVPTKARKVLSSYLKQGMKFFVAKVNLEEQAKTDLEYLRPIQMAFESEKFMLPIRLGTVNAKGPQDMFVFALSREGRIESSNYRTVSIPTDVELPLFVQDDFDEFYRQMFDHEYVKADKRVLFLEYAWDMAWCDPCAADPLSNEQLRELGVFWVPKQPAKPQPITQPRPAPRPGSSSVVRPRIMPQVTPAPDVYVTRLHVRYTAENFPEDIKFQSTKNRDNFQARYIMRHPWTGAIACEYAKEYVAKLPERFSREAKNLARLTDWPLAEIKQRMEKNGQSFSVRDTETKDDQTSKSWWKSLWD